VETLYLARHARSKSNEAGLAWSSAPGEGLAAEGVEQARQLGTALAGVEIDVGVATDLLRTQETLELALEGRGVPVRIVGELDEIDFGTYDGGPLEEYRAWAASHEPTVRPPGPGESRADAARRFAAGLRMLLALTEPTVLFVGHALCLRYFLDGAEGLVPAPLITPVDHALPHPLAAADAARAADVLEQWCRSPRFRDM
jgi:broad specificity phosphatase PhoE